MKFEITFRSSGHVLGTVEADSVLEAIKVFMSEGHLVFGAIKATRVK